MVESQERMREEIQVEMAALKERQERMWEEIRVEMAALKERMQAEMTALKERMLEEIRSEMRVEMERLLLIHFRGLENFSNCKNFHTHTHIK